ncbi:MAG: hypothetical protein RR500_09815, partial [Bacilli bacterium]
TKYDVYNEEDLKKAVANKINEITFKDNITINNSLNLDRFSTYINLNGFILTLSNTFTDTHIFRIGETEYTNFYTKYHKWIKNGVININDKNVYVIQNNFSWNLICDSLRVINTRKGFISYYVSSEQTTRGAEGSLNNITIIASENIGTDEIAFDWYIGDSMINGLYSHCFAIGLKLRVGGIRTSNCHFWGLPFASGKPNQIMKIGVWNANYFNNFNGVISDSPDRINQSIPSSITNGGIAFYDEMGANSRYINCDILEHTSSPNNTLIGFYIDKPSTLEEKYSGQSIYIDSCYSRNPQKLSQGVFYSGNIRNINIKNCDFAINKSGRVRGHNRLTSNTTVYKYDIEEKTTLSDFSLCSGANEMQIINDDFGVSILLRDSNKNGRWARVDEKRNNTYTSAQLQTLADELKLRQTVSGQNVNMGQIFVVKYNSIIADGNVGRYDMCFWSTSSQDFYNLRTGIKETI